MLGQLLARGYCHMHTVSTYTLHITHYTLHYTLHITRQQQQDKGADARSAPGQGIVTCNTYLHPEAQKPL